MKKSSKKKREDWDKIEVEMGEDWDSVKERFKAKMAAAKGTSGKKRKADLYGPLYVAGLAHLPTLTRQVLHFLCLFAVRKSWSRCSNVR